MSRRPEDLLPARLQEIGVTPDPFLRYRDELLRFNEHHNLISRRNPRVLVDHLLWEGVQAGVRLPWNPDTSLMDLGTGGGFPGGPLSILQPTARVVLTDRKPTACDFLRRVTALLGLERAEVWEGQARELSRAGQGVGEFLWITLKAVAAPEKALLLARPFLAQGGRIVLFQRPEWTLPRALSKGWRLDRSIALDRLEGRLPEVEPSCLHLLVEESVA